MGAAGNKFTD